MNGDIICSKINFKNKKIDLVSKFIGELHKINWCDSDEELDEKHHVKFYFNHDDNQFILTFFENRNSKVSLYNMLLAIIASPSERLNLIATGITPIETDDICLRIPIGTQPILISISYELMQTL